MKRWGALYAKGLAMGAADLVPGVSGGTVALISGIYDELVATIAGIDRRLLGVLRTGGAAAAWRAGNFSFLTVLLAGILTSVFVLAGALHWLLEHRPMQLWGFFFGLIAASVPLVARRIEGRLSLASWGWIAGGAALAFGVTSLPPLIPSDAPLLLAGAAALAACAMILPGISGSFILLILGAYAPVIGALRGLDIIRVAAIGAGAALGLLAFSRLLRRLLDRHRATTLSLLTGFLAGSLNALWPWQERIAERYTHSDGRVEWLTENRLPSGATELWPVVGLALAGAGALIALDRAARRAGGGQPAESGQVAKNRRAG